MNKLQTEFIVKREEVTKEHYNKMLEVLPPERMTVNAFLVGEPFDHDEGGRARYDMFFTEKEKFFYAGLATVRDFELWILK